MIAFICLIELPILYRVFIQPNLAGATISKGLAGFLEQLKSSVIHNIYKGIFTLLIPVVSTSSKDINRASPDTSLEEDH
jgi:hypothetical protein